MGALSWRICIKKYKSSCIFWDATFLSMSLSISVAREWWPVWGCFPAQAGDYWSGVARLGQSDRSSRVRCIWAPPQNPSRDFRTCRFRTLFESSSRVKTSPNPHHTLRLSGLGTSRAPLQLLEFLFLGILDDIPAVYWNADKHLYGLRLNRWASILSKIIFMMTGISMYVRIRFVLRQRVAVLRVLAVCNLNKCLEFCDISSRLWPSTLSHDLVWFRAIRVSPPSWGRWYRHGRKVVPWSLKATKASYK